MIRSRAVQIAVMLLLVLGLAYLERLSEETGSPGRTGTEAAGTQAITEAFQSRRSGEWVESQGVVEAVLPDDREGSPHQRFILRLGGDQTILVAHNLDLADRLPLAVGDEVSFRGQYEWNPRGGVVHWTHHDPQGRRAGGWLRHRGTRYD